MSLSTILATSPLLAQQPGDLHPEPREEAQPIPENRGAAALSRDLKRLGTWASLMAIVAHPDDEDGAMLTYESRGLGVRASLLTLTRGEGGQNAMSADSYDVLGVIRTNELLKAGEYYGVRQYWGTEADFGFSKTQEESFARWGKARVLCDTILAVRQERPMVLVATFIGGITDGHGQHQVSGEIAQQAYLQAGDPKVCPEQIAAGLKPWAPLRAYARVPFARVADGTMFDYATGKSAPARFYNYVSKQWSTTEPEASVTLNPGSYDPVLGRSYIQVARQGWGEQKSQNGGANPTLSGGESDDYHLYGSRTTPQIFLEENFFDGIPTGVQGLETLVSVPLPKRISEGLAQIAEAVAKAQHDYVPEHPEAIAPDLKTGYELTESLKSALLAPELATTLPGLDKANLISELDRKLDQFQTALAQSLGLDLQAFTVRAKSDHPSTGLSGGFVEESPRNASPGQTIYVSIHTASANDSASLTSVWLADGEGKPLQPAPATKDKPATNTILQVTIPADASPTKPYFTRPSIEQPYYDVSDPKLLGRSFAPYPLAAWAEFTYDGLPIRVGEVVQTMQHILGPGGVFEPLVITPSIGVRVEPQARILPLDGIQSRTLPVHVTVHTQGAADGTVRLLLPEGWSATPAEATFHRTQSGDSEPILFDVKPGELPANSGKEYSIKAVAQVNAEVNSQGNAQPNAEPNAHPAPKTYDSGWQTAGYPGLRPYNLYRKAEMKTRAIDVKVAAKAGPASASHALRVGYVMGTGDTVPDAIESLGITPHLLSDFDLTSGNLSDWDVILIGIRAYTARPELTAVQPRLNQFVEAGGTLVVEYQGANFPAPFPLSMSGTPERVVEEDAPVKILAPEDRLMTTPNRITSHDFDGWVEERGHSFLDTWDPAYTALTETADAGQDPQRGGFLVAHPGKGTYVYVAYALYRQFPELVSGAYRLLANLLSASR